MKFPSRIYLVGLPGSGKTTFGKYLANELGYSFVDLDAKIEASTGATITTLFLKGEGYFRQTEADQLRSIKGENSVIATGGGTPCFHDNMKWMNSHGFTFFLNLPVEVIVARIAQQTHRPLIGDDPVATIRTLKENRLRWYKEAKMESDQVILKDLLTELRDFFRN